MILRIAGLVRESIVDGPGLRAALFVQGCRRHCPGCHNPQTWDEAGGTERSPVSVCRELFIGKSKLLRGLTISGGEPLLQPEPLAYIAGAARHQGLDVLLYTGFPMEEVLDMEAEDTKVWSLLGHVGLLVTDPYIEAERSVELRWRGSRNQRLWRKVKGGWMQVEDFQ